LLAAALARELPQATIVRSSPALRALWTAEPIAALAGLPLEIDPDLVEVDVGRVEGWTWEDVTRREPRTAAAILTGHVDWPDGERASAVEDRAASVAERIAGTARTRPIVVVSHGRFLSDLARILGTTTGTEGLEPCGVIRIPR
jgi:probable phosphoglycerate mutase